MTRRDFDAAALETVWERLAEGVTASGGSEREALFLAKLALLMAREIGDLERVVALIAEAGRDLD